MDARTLRFLHHFARSRPVDEREILVGGSSRARPAPVYVPARPERAPAWVLLHGVTVPGRHHAALRRMARALAAAGQLVVVPEVESWTALRVEPQEADPAIRDGIEVITRWPGRATGRVGLMGFSVAATWALEVAAAPDPRVAGVVAVGGYGSFARMLRGMVAGEHEWEGAWERYRPDHAAARLGAGADGGHGDLARGLARARRRDGDVRGRDRGDGARGGRARVLPAATRRGARPRRRHGIARARRRRSAPAAPRGCSRRRLARPQDAACARAATAPASARGLSSFAPGHPHPRPSSRDR